MYCLSFLVFLCDTSYMPICVCCVYISMLTYLCVSPDPAMSQLEKKAGLLRRTSSSKKPLKEKVVLMYDEIFAVR